MAAVAVAMAAAVVATGAVAPRAPLLRSPAERFSPPVCPAQWPRRAALPIIAVPHTLTDQLAARMPKRIGHFLNPTPTIPKPLLAAPTPAITLRRLLAAPMLVLMPQPLRTAQQLGITSRLQVEPAIRPSELPVQPRSAPCRRSPAPVPSCRTPSHSAPVVVPARTEPMATEMAIAIALTAGDTAMVGRRDSIAGLSRG